MISVSFRTRDGGALDFGKAGDRIRRAVADVLDRCGALIAADAKYLVREQTAGKCTLEDSIEYFVDEDELEVRIVAGAPHAAYVEFGTVHQEARPYLIPALEQNRAKVESAVRSAVIDELGRMFR